jgi:hypothetical protein
MNAPKVRDAHSMLKNTVTLLTSDMKSSASFEVSSFSDHIANILKLWEMRRSLAKQDKS